jgi:hypothetical protein
VTVDKDAVEDPPRSGKVAKLSRAGLQILLLGLLSACVSARAVASECPVPDLKRTAEQLDQRQQIFGLPGRLYFKTLKVRAGTIVGVSWHGPDGGAIALLDCGGNLVTSRMTGNVLKLELGLSPEPGRQMIQVLSQGRGTGVLVKSVDILVWDGVALSAVWHHTVYEDESQPDERFEETDHWAYRDHGRTIVIAGTRRHDLGGVQHIHERWCWQFATRVYLRCDKPL